MTGSSGQNTVLGCSQCLASRLLRKWTFFVTHRQTDIFRHSRGPPSEGPNSAFRCLDFLYVGDERSITSWRNVTSKYWTLVLFVDHQSQYHINREMEQQCTSIAEDMTWCQLALLPFLDGRQWPRPICQRISLIGLKRTFCPSASWTTSNKCGRK